MRQVPGSIEAAVVLAAALARSGQTGEVDPDAARRESPDREAAPAGVCGLAPEAYARRLRQIDELFRGREETRELEDGYAFRFPGEGEWAGKLLDLVRKERECCRSFTFELAFEPDQGPLWFRVRGSEEVKVFLKTLMQTEAP